MPSSDPATLPQIHPSQPPTDPPPSSHPSTPPRLTSSHTRTFYFAFGSNLSAHQMSLRLTHAPSSSAPVALARLDSWKWIICSRGYANVVRTSFPSKSALTGLAVNGTSGTEHADGKVQEREEGDVVWGILYNMHPLDEATLDRYEGHDEWRNPKPEVNPDEAERREKPSLQGGWDYNKLYLNMKVTKWLRDPGEYGVENKDAGEQADTVRALVYVDEHRLEDGEINAEYIGRMNRAIKESVALGLPESWVDGVMRRWIPKDVDVDDESYIGTDKGYLENERSETLEEVRRRVVGGDGG